MMMMTITKPLDFAPLRAVRVELQPNDRRARCRRRSLAEKVAGFLAPPPPPPPSNVANRVSFHVGKVVNVTEQSQLLDDAVPFVCKAIFFVDCNDTLVVDDDETRCLRAAR